MMRNTSLRWVRTAVISVIAVLGIAQVGCNAVRFGEAALPAVQSGFEQIVNGLMDGFFASLQPRTTADGSS